MVFPQWIQVYSSLPGAIVMGIMSPITGKLFDKYGARSLAVFGLIITIVTTYYFSKISMDTAYSTLVFAVYITYVWDVYGNDARDDKWFKSATSTQ